MMKAKLKEWGIKDATIADSIRLNTLLLEYATEETDYTTSASTVVQVRTLKQIQRLRSKSTAGI